MLLQLENASRDDIDKLLKFAQLTDLRLSLIDDKESNYILPGKPLTQDQLIKLVENSRNSGIIPIEDAHRFIRNSYDAD